jgi:hypothetical protein
MQQTPEEMEKIIKDFILNWVLFNKFQANPSSCKYGNGKCNINKINLLHKIIKHYGRGSNVQGFFHRLFLLLQAT